MPGDTQLTRAEATTYITPRDVVWVLFQHRRLVLWTFSVILVATIAYAIFRPPLYRAQMTVLVNLQRTEPVVTTDPNILPRMLPTISDEEVNSEIELLKSQDLLREVVIASNLTAVQDQAALPRFKNWVGRLVGAKKAPPEVKIAQSVRQLLTDLTVELVPKTTLISVSYSSPDPQLSGKVMTALADLYLRKHLAARRPGGTFDFFSQETDRYHKQLQDAENTLVNFTRDNNVPSVLAEKEATLKKLTDLEVTCRDLAANIAVTNQRIATLESQMAQVPARLTTQVRKASGHAPDQLQSTLLALELKRTELLGIFQPDYPPVKEIDKQITEAKAALAASQQLASVEETTDRDATYEWLRAELQKARVELVDLQSRERAAKSTVAQLSERARWLNDLDVRQGDLARSVKLAEAAYMNYQKKQEEARISDALDRQRILNVAIADKPTVPVLPATFPTALVLLIGMVGATVVSGGLAFGAERINPVFRRPHEVERILELPVVAAIPDRTD